VESSSHEEERLTVDLGIADVIKDVQLQKKRAGTCFLWPQQQSDDKLSAPSLLQKLSLNSVSDSNANTSANAPCGFSYHFPQWQAPFALSVTDGRQSQFQQSVLTCLHLSRPSPLPTDSSYSQALQRTSQCL